MTDKPQRSRNDRFEKVCRNCRWLIVPFLVLAAITLPVRLADPDEFEHLHVGFMISQGNFPYRDFFEHHGPLAYLLSGFVQTGLNSVSDNGVHLVHRGLALFFVVMTFILLRQLVFEMVRARRLAEPTFWLAALALASLPWFWEKGIEWRPDGLAMALMTLAACFAVRIANAESCLVQSLAAVGLGLSTGLATLATLKVLPALGGMAFGLVGMLLARRRTERFLLWSALAGAFFIVPWGIAAAFFAGHEALSAFLYHVLVLPFLWPAPQPAEPFYLATSIGWSAGHVGLLAFLLAEGIWQIRSLRRLARGETMLLAAILAQGMSTWIFPAAYLQHYLLVMPLAAAAAGLFLIRRIADLPRSAPACTSLLLVGAVGLILAVALRRPIMSGAMGQWSRNPFALAEWLAALFALTSLLLVPWSRRRAAQLGGTTLLVAPLMTMFLVAIYWDGGRQRADLALVRALAQPNETVQDGYSGYAWRLPHASYWWWINAHSRPLIEAWGAEGDVIAPLEHRQAAIVLVDREILRTRWLLPSIESHYRRIATGATGVHIFLRKDLPDRDVAIDDDPSGR